VHIRDGVIDMPSQTRLQRIADRIREELSEMLIKEVKDPRVSMVSITDVKVDRELAFADIFISSFEGHEHAQEALEGLRSAAGFLRSTLASRIDLRVFPRLRFHWDPTPERADHIEKLLASIRVDSPSSNPSEPGQPEPEEPDQNEQ
jgi:ribosome-binding factor A